MMTDSNSTRDQKQILVIEDDKDIRISLIELLEDQGYSVWAANNGQQGIELLEQGKTPDLILLDLMMPIKDGFEFRSDQLKDSRFAHIPTVIMTADGSSHERILKTQCSAYIKKPLELDEFLKVVSEQTHKRQV